MNLCLYMFVINVGMEKGGGDILKFGYLDATWRSDNGLLRDEGCEDMGREVWTFYDPLPCWTSTLHLNFTCFNSR